MMSLTNPETRGSRRPTGFPAFALIWSSQVLSILTSGMSGFALTIWMYQRTGSATAMAATQVFYILPFLVMSFFAGPLVDRWSRRLTMALSDLASAVGTVLVLVAFQFGFMDVWIIYVGAVLMGLGQSFQWPAFSAAISTLVPKEQLGRVNGMMSLLDAGPAIFAPILAGAILPFVGIVGILIFDAVTFVIAVGMLFLVEIPKPIPSEEGSAKPEGGIVGDALLGFRWIFSRPPLLGLQLVFLFGNLFSGLGMALLAPMVLARSGADSLVFGGVQTAAAAGGIVGGLAMSAWGGPRRKTSAVFAGWMICGIFQGVLLGTGRSFLAWAVAIAGAVMMMPIINASNQAIWQSKVPQDLQGRVFSARRLIAWITQPITPLIAGPLADFVLEPAMRDPASPASRLLGPFFGVGPGAGMGVIVSATGLCMVGVGLAAFLVPAVREAETRLPDAPTAPVDAPVVVSAGAPVAGASAVGEAQGSAAPKEPAPPA